MNLDRRRLESILNVLGTSVGNKVMKVASYVCFRVDKEKQTVVLATTDFHAYLTMDFGDVSLAGLDDVADVFLINYRELSAIVKTSTTDMVGFTDDGTSIIISTNGRYRFRKYVTYGEDGKAYINTEDFPFADMVHSVSASWPVPEIQSAWSKARIACSKDVTKINYQGIYFDGNFAATDNRRLAVVYGEEYTGPPMLIPPVFGDVLKHCKNLVEVGINDAKTLLVISCKEVGLLAGVRLINATFVNYNKMIESKSPSVTVIANKQSLLSTIQRLTIFADKLFKVIDLKLSSDANGQWLLKVSIENNDSGEEFVDVVGVDVGDEGILDDIKDRNPNGFDLLEHKYQIDNLCDGVAVVDSSDNISLAFEDDGKLWIEEGPFVYLLSSMVE